MSKFKPGQLVMLISTHGFDKSHTDRPVVGSIGEVIPWRDDFSKYADVGHSVAVFFPNYPSDSVSNAWALSHSHIIPINDPDADITEHTEKPVTENLV